MQVYAGSRSPEHLVLIESVWAFSHFSVGDFICESAVGSCFGRVSVDRTVVRGGIRSRFGTTTDACPNLRVDAFEGSTKGFVSGLIQLCSCFWRERLRVRFGDCFGVNVDEFPLLRFRMGIISTSVLTRFHV